MVRVKPDVAVAGLRGRHASHATAARIVADREHARRVSWDDARPVPRRVWCQGFSCTSKINQMRRRPQSRIPVSQVGGPATRLAITSERPWRGPDRRAVMSGRPPVSDAGPRPSSIQWISTSRDLSSRSRGSSHRGSELPDAVLSSRWTVRSFGADPPASMVGQSDYARRMEVRQFAIGWSRLFLGPRPAQTHSYKHWVSVNARRGLRRLRAAVLVLFGLFVLSLVLYVGYATWRVRQVAQGWASSFESMGSFAARFPKTGNSSGAAAQRADSTTRNQRGGTNSQ